MGRRFCITNKKNGRLKDMSVEITQIKIQREEVLGKKFGAI